MGGEGYKHKLNVFYIFRILKIHLFEGKMGSIDIQTSPPGHGTRYKHTIL